MVDRRLTFESLRVDRFYGVRQDGLRIGDLHPRINIVYGPNASGKTTLARSAQTALWPDARPDGSVALEARFALEDASWTVHLDGSRRIYRRDGAESGPPALPPIDQRDRYYLYLHELLRAEDASFAEAIRQAAVGGVDVKGAAEALSFGPVRPRSGSTTRATEEARKKVRRVREAQRDPSDDRRELARLESEREEARAAERRVVVLERAREVHRAAREREEAAVRVEGFPEVMEDLRGDEAERLDEWTRDLEQAREEKQEIDDLIVRSRQTLTESRIPEDGLPEGTLATLRARVDRWERLESELAGIDRRIEGLRDAEAAEWDRFGGGLDRERAAALDGPDVEAVAEFAGEVQAADARAAVLERIEREFGEVEVPGDADALRRAMDEALAWLRAPEEREDSAGTAGATARGIAWGLVVVLIVFSSVVGYAVHWIGYLMLVLPVAAGYLLRFSRGRTGDRSARRTEIERLDVGAPEAWTVEGVRSFVDALRDRLADRAVRARKAAEWDRVEGEREELDARRRELEERAESLAEELGLAPDARAVNIYRAVEFLVRWQAAWTDLRSAEREREEGDEQIAGLRSAVNETLEGIDLDGAEDASEASARLQTLEEEVRALEEARGTVERERDRRERTEARIEELEGKVDDLFAELGLGRSEEARLRQLVERHEAYEEARRNLQDAEARLSSERAKLEETEGFEAELLEADPETIERELAEARERAERSDDLSERIGKLEESIDRARREDALAEARAEHRDALDELRREREEDCRSAVGWEIARYVERQTRDQELPGVFHAARDLFRRISRGRYRLDFDASASRFRAHDSIRDRGFALEELSGGSRVQLLLAVRIAFVERQEQGARLPVVLDETLANSDDEKARAIIEAVEEISRDRQVFYLTAQDDEVGKWIEALEGSRGIDFELHALEDVPLPEDGARDATPSAAPLGRELPNPGETGHGAYGAAIEVPRWSLREPLGALHLWYLIDEVEALDAALRAGVSRWGALSRLGAGRGAPAAGLDEATYLCTEARARAVEIYRSAWHTGRGRRVDRAVLEDSGAVSDAFIDRVAEVCEEVEGDAEAILEAVSGEEKRVSGFYEQKAEELEAYFRRHDYLDPQTTLSEEEIWARVLEGLSEEIAAGLVTTEEIRTVFERIEAGPPRR